MNRIAAELRGPFQRLFRQELGRHHPDAFTLDWSPFPNLGAVALPKESFSRKPSVVTSTPPAHAVFQARRGKYCAGLSSDGICGPPSSRILFVGPGGMRQRLRIVRRSRARQRLAIGRGPAASDDLSGHLVSGLE